MTGRGTKSDAIAAVTRCGLTAAALIGGGLAWSAPAGAAGPPLVRSNALWPGAAPSGSTPLGPVPATQTVHLSVVLPPADQATLQSLLGDLDNPSSPRYHQWLSPGQFLARFGPSPAAVAGVKTWLRRTGLTGRQSGFAVDVSAPAHQVALALGTRFERYATPAGVRGYAATVAPLLPQNLSGHIAEILGLNTLTRFQPDGVAAAVPATVATPSLQPEADGLTACPAAQAIATSVAAIGTATGTSTAVYTLDQLGAAYGLGPLLAGGQNGQGEKIGLYEQASHSASDVSTYLSCFGLTNPVSTVPVDGGGGAVGGGGTNEADFDIEQAATQAPGASIVSYEAPDSTTQDAYDIWNTIVSSDAVQVVSTSWTACETTAQAQGQIPSFTTLFEQAAAQGQTVLAASGDGGSEGCFGVNGSTQAEVTYPASDPWVTAVGGTNLLGPGDEVAWNNCQSQASVACADKNGAAAAGGGGMSRYETRPSDQPNDLSWPTAQPCGEQCREVPDLSANGGARMIVYVNGAWGTGTGTSFAAPLMAGLVADKNDGCTAASGLLATALYSLYAAGSYGTAFTDITSGNTDMTGSNGGAYAAGPGYDLATGIGSPLAAGLSCPEVSAVAPGPGGGDATISGLGLEHATFTFGATVAQVLSATATQATVVVPAGSGTVTVRGTSALGTGTVTSSFTLSGTASPPPSSSPPPSTPPPLSAPASGAHGYWLVGSDGGIFAFGSAPFYGSTGSLHLQRPVVGITASPDRGGYWLTASDGGIFSFGDVGFYGSIPGLGLAPAGTAGPTRRLNAPIVGMVPSADGRGYFLVGADGGVFAFGDAAFEGSCPGIGGCSGAAVAVVPDASGQGYWLVTNTGHVYAFGDAASLGAPGPQATPVTAAARSADGNGYYILSANGTVAAYGDATALGGPTAAVSPADPATAIVTLSGSGGYWVVSADGGVYTYGGAPFDGSMAGLHLNGPIVAGAGF